MRVDGADHRDHDGREQDRIAPEIAACTSPEPGAGAACSGDHDNRLGLGARRNVGETAPPACRNARAVEVQRAPAEQHACDQQRRRPVRTPRSLSVSEFRRRSPARSLSGRRPRRSRRSGIIGAGGRRVSAMTSLGGSMRRRPCAGLRPADHRHQTRHPLLQAPDDAERRLRRGRRPERDRAGDLPPKIRKQK